MKPIIPTAVIVLGLATQAQASDQIALGLNLAPGTYSTSELVQLQAARDDGNAALFNHLMNEFGGTQASASVNASAAQEQLAASVGVSANDFTITELVQLRTAMSEGDTARMAFIASGDGDVAPGAAPSHGRQQLAAFLGVDASSYSLADLTRMYMSAID